MSAQLVAEWLGLDPLAESERDRLGITRRTEERVGGLASAKVLTSGRCRYPEPRGLPAIILPVFAGGAPHWRDNPQVEPLLLDLIALRESEPDWWWYRDGSLDSLMLGKDALAVAHTQDIPLPLYRSPLAWLRGGIHGALFFDVAERTRDAIHEQRYTADLRAWWDAA